MPLLLCSADSARLSVVYGSVSSPGETAQTSDVAPYESASMGAVAVRRACPGA